MTITLKLNTSAQYPEPVGDWHAESYILAPTARAAGVAPTEIKLAPNAVLELELENGIRLLVAAEDAGRYLGDTTRGGDADGAPIQVGAVLRPTALRPPPGVSRDGVGSWVLKALRVFQRGPAGVVARTAAAAFQDNQLGHRNGLFQLALDQWQLTPVSKLPALSEPILLFLHGTASSTEGSFRGLWGGQSPVDVRNRLQALYGGRVYGFEHRSLTESPIANALALVESLPQGARLHVVSHSRGGMIGELLARANRDQAEPFSEPEIQRFLAQAKTTGRTGYYEADGERLRQLNEAMKTRSIRVERFVRVAAPVRGTTLASGRLDRWASVMLNLFGHGLDLVPGWQPIVGPAYTLLQNFLLAVVKERTDARLLPGLEAMMPDSPLVALLNAPDVEVDSALHIIAGDYEGQGLLSWLVDCMAEAFYAGATDLVVNTPSMSGGARRRQGIWLKPLAGAQVHHLSYFRREPSVTPMLEALTGSNTSFESLVSPSRVDIARGGQTPLPKANAPIALVLPGIMGSQLASKSNLIWFNPLSMIAGGMDKLDIDARNVTTVGWIDSAYEDFAKFLAKSHEVRPFAYDWRQSILLAADDFGKTLDAAMHEAEKRQKPLRIVAHSMGGLVARLALASRWERFKAIPGSRLVQFGTPNQGSHSIAAVLMGRDSFVQMIERWGDWKHDMHQFLAIVTRFPGVLELLPWSDSDGLDYFDPGLWQNWHQQDTENRQRGGKPVFEVAKGAGDGWPTPIAEHLQDAKAAVLHLKNAPLDPDCTLYVAGSGRTPAAIRLTQGKVEIGWTREGDGRVPWATGIPQGVRVWYVNAAHGDLLDHKEAFPDYVSLLESGNCRLSTTPVGSREAGGITFLPVAFQGDTLYPTPEEVLAAALGARPPRPKTAATSPPAAIDIIHGSLAGADTPVLIGAYAHDSLRGSADFLNRQLEGRLARAQALGRYPNLPEETLVFQNPKRGAKPGGAIVVGLGAVGELKPGTLTQTLREGLLEYARIHEPMTPPPDGQSQHEVSLSSLLVGTGFAGLSVKVGMRCLAEALYLANKALEHAHMNIRIARLDVFEEDQTRSITAAEALRDLIRESKFEGSISYDGRIREAQGHYCGAHHDQAGASGWYRVHITDGSAQGGLRFTLITDRARNEVKDEANQRQIVDSLIKNAVRTTADQPGLARALFELMVPNDFKEAIPQISGLILGVDQESARYPWEFMRDRVDSQELPLATRIGLIRQLASPHGRRQPILASKLRLLVVGDTQSGLTPLPGAKQEGILVDRLFRERGYDTRLLTQADAQTVILNLLDEDYRFMHLAAHGHIATGPNSHTGMVLGPNTYLTTAQIQKLRHVPELVFINCCHLGQMDGDARPHRGELAANLATEFIEMGCKAVIAAGWAVDDDAAGTFAQTFYQAMLDGKRFGEAVREAREQSYRRHPTSNTWGAYQAYGDEQYRLPDTSENPWQAPAYLHASQIIADLEVIAARIGPATSQERDRYAQQLEAIEKTARAGYFHHAEIRECLAEAWSALGNKSRAIEHYQAALIQSKGRVSLRALEQLGNLEVRRGADLAATGHSDAQTLMDTGLDRLTLLLALGKTTERLALLGSSYKRQTQCLQDSRAADSEAKITAALQKMQQAYREASDYSLEFGGERDYYPTLNALDGALALAMRGERQILDDLAGQRAEWLAAATRNAEHRYRDERSFFHAFAEIEAKRIDALWACLDGREAQALTRAEVHDPLTAEHKHLFFRLGDAREHDSALNQLRWLIAMLPPGNERDALRRLMDAIVAI